MSAMLGVCLPDRLHLMSDGAVFCEGAWLANERFLNAAARRATSFDDLVDQLEDVLDEFDEAMREADHIDTELLIGGWSDDLDRPRLLYRAMHDRTPGVEPGNVYEVTAFTTGMRGCCRLILYPSIRRTVSPRSRRRATPRSTAEPT